MSDIDKDVLSAPQPKLHEVLRIAEQAERLLMPVYVDFGSSQPRFRSFVDSVRGQGKDAVLYLSPIAAKSIPLKSETSISIRPVDTDSDWMLSVSSFEAVDDVSVAVKLERARLLTNARSKDSALRQACDSLILVVSASVIDQGNYVFPISEISSKSCIIETNTPFEPGTTIQLVEIIGDKRVLRRALAHVNRVELWFMPDGSQRFRCTLDLRPSTIDYTEEVFTIIKDARRVRQTIVLAGLITAYGWYEVAEGKRESIRFVRVERDFALLELVSPRGPALQGRATIRIGLEVFAIYYEMEVRVLSIEDNMIGVTLPLVLKRRRQHRRAERVLIPHHYNVLLRYYDPTTGSFQERSVDEISYIGVSFRCRDNDPLWQELVLEDAVLVYSGQLIKLGDLEVRSIASRDGVKLCHTSIYDFTLARNPLLIKLIASLSHPDITFHDGSNLSSLIDVYVRAGLFSPHMYRNYDPMVREVKEVWKKLHRNASDVVRTLISGPIDSPSIAMTSIRAWEKAWMLQHFVSVDPKFDRVIGRMQLAALDHVLPRSDGHYVLFFVKADNQVVNAFLNHFFSSSGTADSVTATTVSLWCRPGDSKANAVEISPDVEIRPLSNEEELVSRAAQKALGILPAAALSMFPGEFYLPESKRSFAKAGLLRDRSCRIATFRDRPVYAVLEERSSPGINLTWMLNANWILPIHPHFDHDDQALEGILQDILKRPSQSPMEDRFLNVPTNVSKRHFLNAGFELLAPVNLYVLSRAGFQRYYYYAASRYGALYARILRRKNKKRFD